MLLFAFLLPALILQASAGSSFLPAFLSLICLGCLWNSSQCTPLSLVKCFRWTTSQKKVQSCDNRDSSSFFPWGSCHSVKGYWATPIPNTELDGYYANEDTLTWQSKHLQTQKSIFLLLQGCFCSHQSTLQKAAMHLFCQFPPTFHHQTE